MILTANDLELPRDPQQPLQAATKQYVDKTSLSASNAGTLFDRFFTVVQIGYTIAMTPFYEWTETPVGLTLRGMNLKTTSFVETPPNCLAGTGMILSINSSVYISRKGQQEGFFPVSAIGSSALTSLNAFFSIPRTAKHLYDGTIAILTHRCSNGYTLENITLDGTVSLKINRSLTTSHWFVDLVQSKTDSTRIVLVGCDSSGPAIYSSTNLAAPVKATFTG